LLKRQADELRLAFVQIMNVKKIFALFVLVLCAFVSFSQTAISGIINKYAAVSDLNFCNNTATVDNTTGFFAGQKVLLIQMKGAQINTANNSAYGDIVDYKGAGNYEIEVIKSVSGNVIEFQFAVLRNYESSGSIQLVSFEEFSSAVVTAPLTAKPWDGASGGVIFLKADTLILNDSIDVHGMGFRGAQLVNDVTCFNNGTGGATDYFCATSDCGAPKGEGIGNSAYNFGRGKNGNGGGGGDDHNTGGGGGSNFGSGGVGGIRSNVSNFSCPGPAPGVGGGSLVYNTANQKIFLGGGGGAGDENNNEGTAGCNGGGMVLIMANTLVSNNQKINANGNSAPVKAQSDGAGGGGGGGTVLLFVDNFVGNLEVDANGGDGGNLDNGGSYSFCFGPGGGGGGGALWVKGNSIPPNINFIDTGGKNGKDIFGLGPAACPYGTTNGAQHGNDGGSITGFDIPYATVPFLQLFASACCDTTVCAGSYIELTAEGIATYPPTFLWSTGETTQNIFVQVFNTEQIGVTISDSRGCTVVEILTATVLNTIPNVTVCCDTTICPGGTAIMNVEASGSSVLTYNWSTGDHSSIIAETIISSQAYIVTITDQNGCSLVATVTANVNNQAANLNACCDTIVCTGNAVLLNAFSSSVPPLQFVWSNGQINSSATPTVQVSQSFTVTVTDANGCSNSQSVSVTVPIVQTGITAVPDTSILLGQTVQLTASGDSLYSFEWSPVSGLSSTNTSVTIAKPDVTTTYCVTATDTNHCTASACYKIELVLPEVKIPDAFTPNGDGHNDGFSIFPLKFAEITEIRIYNRWGEVVFDSKQNLAWDGTYKGKLQDSGAFVCEVTYTSVLNPGKYNTITKGFVLIR
jgi:gliding motility-associated-like protein